MPHHHKKCKKYSKKTTETKSTTNTYSSNSHSQSHSHSNYHPHPHCKCEQLFYAPLPNLPTRPPTQTVTPIEWFAPGSVQSCCSTCSSVKPVYSTPCDGYCCKQ